MVAIELLEEWRTKQDHPITKKSWNLGTEYISIGRRIIYFCYLTWQVESTEEICYVKQTFFDPDSILYMIQEAKAHFERWKVDYTNAQPSTKVLGDG